MSRRPPVLPSLSLVVSLLALLLVVAGTSYAAGLARNSVGALQLKKNAVTAVKIKKGAVTAPKLRNGSVTAPKIGPGAVTGATVRDRSLTATDLAAGVLPTNVAFDHAFALGESPGGFTVAGVEFEHVCLNNGGGAIARTNVRPAASGANDLSVSGSVLTVVGATRTSNPIYGSGSSSFEPSADAPSGMVATSSFEGMVRSGTKTWLRVLLTQRSSPVQDPDCRVRGLVTTVP